MPLLFALLRYLPNDALAQILSLARDLDGAAPGWTVPGSGPASGINIRLRPCWPRPKGSPVCADGLILLPPSVAVLVSLDQGWPDRALDAPRLGALVQVLDPAQISGVLYMSAHPQLPRATLAPGQQAAAGGPRVLWLGLRSLAPILAAVAQRDDAAARAAGDLLGLLDHVGVLGFRGLRSADHVPRATWRYRAAPTSYRWPLHPAPAGGWRYTRRPYLSLPPLPTPWTYPRTPTPEEPPRT